MNTLPEKRQTPARGFFPGSQTAKPLIIIVGPNEDTRTMLRALLELWGYDVLEADTADKSLALSGKRHPSLILIESTLHFTDSLDDITMFKNTEGLKDTPAVMVSGFSQESYRDAAISSGASAFLVKPVDFDILREYLSRLIDENTSHKKQGGLSQ